MVAIVKSQETREGVQFRLFTKGEFKFAHKQFNNYFYIKTTDYETVKEEIVKKFRFCLHDVKEVGQFSQIFLSNNFMRNKIRVWIESQFIRTYEADIKANKRYLLDNELPLNNEELPYAFFDIETDDRLPLIKDDWGKTIPQSRIVSYSSVNHNGEVEYFQLGGTERVTGVGDNIELLESLFNDEQEILLLRAIIKDLAKYGVVSGWYSKKFDMPYIKGRCDELGVDYKILDYVNHVDYKELFSKYDKKSRTSNSLNAISNEVLKESKIDQKKGNGAIYNTWKDNPVHLRKYNIEDSNLIYKINAKRLFIEVSMKRANNAKTHVQNTVNNTDSGDYMIMRRYKSRNIIMPSEPNKAEKLERQKMQKISGGYTRCLIPGFYDSMDVYDQKSFYPMQVGTFNISPETYVRTLDTGDLENGQDYSDYIVTPSNWNEEKQRLSKHRLYTKELGVFPELALELVAERDKIKYTMKKYKHEFLKDGTKNPDYDPDKYKQQYLEQYAIKVDANSYFYGILAYPGSRYFHWEIADSITTCCQAVIKESYTELKKIGCDILGGDTDSTFIRLNKNKAEDVDKFLADFYETWSKKWNVVKCHLLMEHEKTVKNFLFVMKKNYAYIDEGELKIVGLEAIKSDTNPKAAELQKQLIEDICLDRMNMEKWENKVEELYGEVFDQELTNEEVIMNKGLSKMPSEYEGYVIAKATGKPKVKADGTLQKKSIPAHVKLASRLMEQGRDINIGSKIHFVVIKTKPNLAISPEEFAKGEGIFITKHKKVENFEYEFAGDYDAPYYWERIMTPFMKVMHVYNKGLPDWSWGLTDSAKKKILKKLGQEDE